MGGGGGWGGGGEKKAKITLVTKAKAYTEGVLGN